MSDYSALEDSLGVLYAWPLTDATTTFVERKVGGNSLTVLSGSATPQNAVIANGQASTSLAGTLNAAGALSTISDFTLNVWIRIAANQAPGIPLYVGSSGGDGVGMFVAAHHSGGAGNEFQGLMGGVGFVDSAPTSVTLNTPVMLSLTRTGGTTFRLYLNGVLVGSGAPGANLPTNLTEVTLVGDVGFIGVWSSALSAANLLALYGIGAAFVVDTPMALTWNSVDAVYPVITDPLVLDWHGVAVHLPVIPPLFPITGRRALTGPAVCRVAWTGAAGNPASGFNAFTVAWGVAYTITAQVYDIDGSPGLPATFDHLDVFLGNQENGYQASVTSYDTVTGIVVFDLPTNLVDYGVTPGVWPLRLIGAVNVPGPDPDDILSFPTFPCAVTVTE